MPIELVGVDDWQVVVDSGTVDTTEQEDTLDGFLIDASWFQNGIVLCNIGFGFAWSIALNSTKRWSIKDMDDPNRQWSEWDSIMSYINGNEIIVRGSVQALMVGIVAELKTQVDAVSMMQTKILGAFFSSAMVVAAFMYHQLSEDKVDAWAEVVVNRTIG